jgi:hypothetical protein
VRTLKNAALVLAPLLPLQGYRAAFEAWFKEVGPERLWAEAEKL